MRYLTRVVLVLGTTTFSLAASSFADAAERLWDHEPELREAPPAVRLYRHRDKFEELPAPVASRAGDYFWIHQTFDPDKTFPDGFDYYFVARIASGAATVELDHMQSCTTAGNRAASSPAISRRSTASSCRSCFTAASSSVTPSTAILTRPATKATRTTQSGRRRGLLERPAVFQRGVVHR